MDDTDVRGRRALTSCARWASARRSTTSGPATASCVPQARFRSTSLKIDGRSSQTMTPSGAADRRRHDRDWQEPRHHPGGRGRRDRRAAAVPRQPRVRARPGLPVRAADVGPRAPRSAATGAATAVVPRRGNRRRGELELILRPVPRQRRLAGSAGVFWASCARPARRREGMQLPKAPELVVTGLAAVLLVGSVVGLANTSGGGGPAEPGEVPIEGFAFGPDVSPSPAAPRHLDQPGRRRPHGHPER